MILLRWLVSALGFLALSQLIPGITVASFTTALVLALLWGVVNITIKPILILLTLPFNILTLGIFTFIINGFLLWLLGGVVKGFEVQGFWVAVLGALFLSAISTLSQWAFTHRGNDED
jgi:putative membrane protein